MPSWVISLVEFAINELLKQIDTSDVAKKALATLLRAVDTVIQTADKTVSGPFKDLADEVAKAFHTAVEDICKALGQ